MSNCDSSTSSSTPTSRPSDFSSIASLSHSSSSSSSSSSASSGVVIVSKPFSASADRNRWPIGEELKRLYEQHHVNEVLEVSSGSGQHAVHFASLMPNLRYHPSEYSSELLNGIQLWIDDYAYELKQKEKEKEKENEGTATAALTTTTTTATTTTATTTATAAAAASGHKIQKPLQLNVDEVCEWSVYLREQYGYSHFDAIFNANTLHIISWAQCVSFLSHIHTHARTNALLTFYGPFKYGGEFTTPSNAVFDEWLKQKHGALSGIRDFESVDALLREHGWALVEDVAMPANNQCITWKFAGKATQ